MVTNTPKRHQKYAMPKFECRPRPLWSSIAHAPVTMAGRPNRTWMPTPARKSGLVDGIGMPKSTVFSGGIGFHSVFYIGPRFAGVGSAASTIATISATSHGRSDKRAAKATPRGLTEQDPAAWDLQMTEEAEALLRRASAMGTVGRYQLEGRGAVGPRGAT